MLKKKWQGEGFPKTLLYYTEDETLKGNIHKVLSLYFGKKSFKISKQIIIIALPMKSTYMGILL